MIIFENIYDGESIVDVPRDIFESFDPRFNSRVESIPTDEFGFQKGSFVVTVKWVQEE